MERAFLAGLPKQRPSTDRHVEARVSRDGFVRVASADYSVPPGLAGRRVAVTISPTEIVVSLEGSEIARHRRSWVRADVVLAPAHVRALRLHRQAKARLEAGDVTVPTVDLRCYDQAVGVAP